MPGTTVGRGNLLYTFLIRASLTPVAVAANSTVEQSFTVPGLQLNDQISSINYLAAYTVNADPVNARASAANTLTIAFMNGTGAPVTPPSGFYLIEVNRAEAAQFADLPATAG